MIQINFSFFIEKNDGKFINFFYKNIQINGLMNKNLNYFIKF